MKSDGAILYQPTALFVFQRQGGGWRLLEQFSVNEEGQQRFSRWWQQQAAQVYTLLLDIPEEDFSRETLPHATGTAQKRMVQRKLEQLYRGHPLRLAVRQTRQAEGRRDDAYLMSALPQHNTLLIAWLALWAQLQVPIARIISIPYALQAGFLRLHTPHVPVAGGAVLWVMMQEQRLRQIVCVNGCLHFSRSSVLPVGADAQAVVAEVRLSLQFFSGIKDLVWPIPIPVMLLGDASSCLEAAAQQLQQDSQLCVQYWRTELLDESLGSTLIAHYPAWRLALCAIDDKKTPAYTYAPIHAIAKRYRVWKALYRLSLIGLVCALLLGAYFLYHIVQLQQANQQLKQRVNVQAQQAGLGVQYSPQQMRGALQIYDDWLKPWPSWRDGLHEVAQGLDAHPRVELDTLVWWVSYNPLSAPSDIRPVALHPQTQQEIEQWAAQQAPTVRLWQQIEVHGHLKTPKGQYRAALQEVQALQKTLSQQGSLVIMVDAPLNTRPDTQIQASEQASRATGAFVLRLLKPIRAQESP